MAWQVKCCDEIAKSGQRDSIYFIPCHTPRSIHLLIGSLAATAYVAYQTSEWADKEAKTRAGNIYDNVTRRF